MFDPIQIDLNLKKRESGWIQVCPNCQCERFISYAQAWNITSGICKKECKPCSIELGLYKINTEHLHLGRKFFGGTTGKKLPGKTKQMIYQSLFNPVSKRPEIRKKMREAKLGKTGENANNWQGGKISERKVAMARDDYKKWRIEVFKRDKFTCQSCKKIGGTLHAHHIKYWSKNPELRYEISNGLTLCKSCHVELHNREGRY